MPILKSTYSPPFIFRNYHLSTIYASMLRKVPPIRQSRERIELEDGDFIDIDWSFFETVPSDKLVVILHGLEGNSQRPYVMGMVHKFLNAGWDAAAVNLRGCSGEINRLYRSYNAGASEDLKAVLDHVLRVKNYTTITLVGFSLGGNLMLKYLGEGNTIHKVIEAAVAISTPCDLYKSLKRLEEPQNFLYSRRFVNKLKKQLHLRGSKFPSNLSAREISECRSLYAIDELYTGKAHGFKNARDYYKRSSALNFIPYIGIPTLLINAKNDSFLSSNSSPVEMAKANRFFYLETPEYGGHVGFIQKKKSTYAEDRALEFISSNSSTKKDK